MKLNNRNYNGDEVNYIDELKQCLEFFAWFALIVDTFLGIFVLVDMVLGSIFGV